MTTNQKRFIKYVLPVVLIVGIVWVRYGAFDRRLGFDLAASAESAAMAVAKENKYLIVREQPHIFVDAFSDISLGQLIARSLNERSPLRFERSQRLYHFRILVEDKAYYWSFRERAFLPAQRRGLHDIDGSLAEDMRLRCERFLALDSDAQQERLTSIQQRYDIIATNNSFCR